MIAECEGKDITLDITFGKGNAQTGGFLTTFTGQEFNPINPSSSTINIKDIANALSKICRFGGHSNKFYSVAQHSVMVSNMCNEEDALAGLLHDASEAYIGDMVRPLKYTDKMENYRDIEHNLAEMIAHRFGLDTHMTESVKRADNTMCVIEALMLFTPSPKWALEAFDKLTHNDSLLKIEEISIWAPNLANFKFLERFKELTTPRQLPLSYGIGREVEEY